MCALQEDIFIGHWCFLHHLNGAVGRFALEALWLCHLFCCGYTPISFITRGFMMRWICMQNLHNASRIHKDIILYNF